MLPSRATGTSPPSKRNRPRLRGPARAAFAFAVAALIGASLSWPGRAPDGSPPLQAGPDLVQAPAERWQCPMHPSVVQDYPGRCTICGMNLVRVGPAGPGSAP